MISNMLMNFNSTKYSSIRFLGIISFIFSAVVFPQKIYSSEYLWTCSNEDGFLSVFRVVDKPFPSITHISSYDPESGKKWSLYSPLKVISREKNYISTVDLSLIEELNEIVLDVFNLDKKTILTNSIYLDGSNPELQKYNCN